MSENERRLGTPLPDGSEPARQRRLLVAEDNLANQKVALAMLRKTGWQADVAGDGAQAVEAFRRSPYAAILMDCQMPVLDGYAATAAIRELEAGGTRTPIIAMTASAMSGDEERCRAAGMDDYVPKPIMLDQLTATLHRWVGDAPKPRATASATTAPADPFDPKRVAMLKALDTPDRPDSFLHFATVFVQQGADQVAALGRALAERDWERARQEAHTLRGGAATIGAARLAEQCTALEERLAGGGPAHAETLASIQAEFDVVNAAVARRAVTAARSG